MLLTPHFSLEEFTLSSTALALDIENKPMPEHLENLRKLAQRFWRSRSISLWIVR